MKSWSDVLGKTVNHMKSPSFSQFSLIFGGHCERKNQISEGSLFILEHECPRLNDFWFCPSIHGEEHFVKAPSNKAQGLFSSDDVSKVPTH